MPAGSCVVFVSTCGRAVFGVSWPRYARHRWKGAWINTLFRNEGAGLSSELIREAVAATAAEYGAPPALGMITMIKQSAIRDGFKPGRQVGRCYIKAGFREIGRTIVHGHRVFQLLPVDMPSPASAIGTQRELELA